MKYNLVTCLHSAMIYLALKDLYKEEGRFCQVDHVHVYAAMSGLDIEDAQEHIDDVVNELYIDEDGITDSGIKVLQGV